MITSEKVKNELYVWIWIRGIKQLLYKRWLDRGFGMVMDIQPFTAKDTESHNQSITCSGVKREGESCTKNNNCTYPNCK
jgi:hypothetical protein